MIDLSLDFNVLTCPLNSFLNEVISSLLCLSSEELPSE